MDINKSCKLFLRGVYLYDITSCHYVILQRLGFDISKIDKDDKLKRNTQIGLEIRANPRLGKILRDVTIATIGEYLSENNISEKDIIIRQYDGILTTKKLDITKGHIPIDLQKFFDIFIISIDRSSYLASDSSSVIIKGIPDRYEKMDEVYKQLCKIASIQDKTSIFEGLKKIKEIIFKTQDINYYCIPTEEEDKFVIFLKQYGEIEVSKSTAKILDISEVDRQKYFDFYLLPFTMSICKEFL